MDEGGPHRALDRRESRRRGLDGEDWRRRTGRSSGTGRSGASQGVWRHGATLGGTAKRYQGSEAQVIVGGIESRRRNDSPAVMVRTQFRRCKGLDRGRGARGGSLGRGESTGGHGVAGAAAERCGRGGAVRRHGGAVLERRLGLVAALGVEGEGSGGPQCLKREGPRISTWEQGRKAAGVSAGDLGRCAGAREAEERDGTDRRARAAARGEGRRAGG